MRTTTHKATLMRPGRYLYRNMSITRKEALAHLPDVDTDSECRWWIAGGLYDWSPTLRDAKAAVDAYWLGATS